MNENKSIGYDSRWIVFHFSKSILETMTFKEFGLGLLEIRVILRGKIGFYDRSKVLEKWS